MLRGFAVEPSRVLVSRENYLDLVNVVNRIDSTQTDLVGRVERLEEFTENNCQAEYEQHKKNNLFS